MSGIRRYVCSLLGLALATLAGSSWAASPIDVRGSDSGLISMVVRDTPIEEVFEMLSRKERVSILVTKGVEGPVSVNLFDVSLDRAVGAIAESGGYVAERRRGGYVILARKEAGLEAAPANTIVRALKVQYSDATAVSEILANHISRYGEINVFEQRKLIVIEDLPEFVERIENLLSEIDREPRLILIEAKILEITLDENDAFGIDWSKFFSYDGGTGTFGTQGLSGGTAGIFFDLMTPNIEVALDALSEKGRVRTLSTPSLLALEHEPAEVVIGDRLGFRVTTTINQVTTESIEFLESGVILRFTAAVDRMGRILLDVHPEVSTGLISDGLPSQTTAEVTTKLLTEEGQKVFIAGLIKDRSTQGRSGVPWLMDVPVVGRLFSRNETITVDSETVVVISAHVVPDARRVLSEEKMKVLPEAERALHQRGVEIDRAFRGTDPTGAGPAHPAPDEPQTPTQP
jgi:type II secretory pathway component GspD/PulD (secretin)